MSIYKIFKNGKEIQRIVADEEFVSEWCPQNGYTYELEPEMRAQPEPEPPEPTQADRLRADLDYIAALEGITL